MFPSKTCKLKPSNNTRNVESSSAIRRCLQISCRFTMSAVVLSNEKALVGKDLGNAFKTFKERRVTMPATSTEVARFKRKEPVTR